MVFGEEGFTRATLAGVAKRAGVSPATVSHYFGSKAALFEAMVAEEVLELAGTAPILVGDISPAEALCRLLDAKWQRLTRPGMPEMTLTVLTEVREFPESARHLFRQLSERHRQRLEQVIEAGRVAGQFRVVDARTASIEIDALVLGAMINHHFVAGCTGEPTGCDGGLPHLLNAVARLVGATAPLSPAATEPMDT